MTRKHVAFIAPSLGVGGAEIHLVQYANALIARGLDVSIIVVGKDTTVASRLHGQVRVLTLDARVRSPITWLRCAQAVRRLKPDVVVGWALWGNALAVAGRLFGSRIRTVIVELNYLPRQLEAASWVERLVVMAIVKGLYGCADVVAANSDEIIKWLKTILGPDVVYSRQFNPMDFDRADALALEAIPERDSQWWTGVRVLAVGRMVLAHKGFDILVKACAQLPESLEWKLILIGSGKDEHKLKEIIDQFDLSHNIKMIGSIDNPFSYYNKADIVVVPSRFEGFPNVLLEAMAVGRATIAADCLSGPRELTEEGRVGVLVPVDDTDALSEALSSLILNADRRASLGLNARTSTKERYSEHQVFEALSRALG
ncbi:glycosyltransferase [Brevundimonas staleyi]|uniref:Glycosyltransferase n=1 Tax=Brevundimonas staleyi TaxID=74326 RepID=A0ABW0FW38_9CAUL